MENIIVTLSKQEIFPEESIQKICVVYHTITHFRAKMFVNFAKGCISAFNILKMYLVLCSERLQHIPLLLVQTEVSLKELILYLVPGWDQYGTKLLHKKAAYLIQVMFFASKAISLDEMMKAIEYKNRATFRKNYLEALERTGIVAKTIPDIPSSPDQKYTLTDTGKLFLSGQYVKLG